MPSNFFSVIAVFALTGCIAQSKIQGQYIEAQDHCREAVESRAAVVDTNTPAGGDPNAVLARQFAECMNKSGWHLATPKPIPGAPAPTNTAQNAPTGSPPQLVNSAATQPATTAAQPAPVSVVPQAAPSYIPPSSSGQAPAVYQPGRPLGSDNNYGTGAGRQF